MSLIYPKYLIAVAKGLHDWTAMDVRALLCSSAYTQDDAHEFISDLSGVLATGAASLANKTVTLVGDRAVHDADDYTFSAPTGGTATQLILAAYTGVSSTSRLIACVPLPQSQLLNGSDFVANFSNTANEKIFFFAPVAP